MILNLFQQKKINDKYVYIILFVASFLLILPSFKLGFFGDDFSWLMLVKQNQSQSFFNILSHPQPYGFFRPASVMFFNLLFRLFGDNFLIYRIFINIFYFLCAVFIYKILLKLNYEKLISLLSSILFLALACHAEVIYQINSLNIIVSDLFALMGLFLFIDRIGFKKNSMIILCFLVSLLCRESSVCFILLLILIKFRLKNKTWKEVILISLIVIVFYFAIRVLFEIYNPELFSYRRYDMMDFNPVKLIYKISHYFLSIMIPTKSIFEIIGFEYYVILREIFVNPDSNLALFIAMLVFLLIFVVIFSWFAFKVLKSKLTFPILFTYLCLLIYIPAVNVSERFTFFASVGICLLIVLSLTEFSQKFPSLASGIFIIFILVHSVTLYVRTNRYFAVSQLTYSLIEDLNKKILPTDKVSTVVLKNFPDTIFGQKVVNAINFSDGWKYFYPQKHVSFIMSDTIDNNDAGYFIFYFDNETQKFEMK